MTEKSDLHLFCLGR